MQEYFFANYRLLTDDGIVSCDPKKRLINFTVPMPFTHTFTLRIGDAKDVDEKWIWAFDCPVVLETDRFTIHDTGAGWAFVDKANGLDRIHRVLLCDQTYGDMIAYITETPYYSERLGRYIKTPLPISSTIRAACEAGMVMRDGLPLHASLVEKDGEGVIFLGPSGMGKSTQAKLWEQYLGADFLIGDRPGLRRIDGKWVGFGMPWDGKDNIYRQVSVPVRALVWLEQAKENCIEPMNQIQAMTVMLKQAMMPIWDDKAMDGVSTLMGAMAQDVPMYHLHCLPDEAAARLTYEMIYKKLPMGSRHAKRDG